MNNSVRPKRTQFYLIGLVCVMLSASFAAVPFYDWFCKVTGYGGTPETYSDSLDFNDLNELNELLKIPDWDLLNFIMYPKQTPVNLNSKTFERLRNLKLK